LFDNRRLKAKIYNLENQFMYIMIRAAIFLLLLTAFSHTAYSQKPKPFDPSRKIEEASPKMLPQSPAAEKLRSDARDKNLKGKVESVIEELLESGKAKRERYSEAYYNADGNLIKEVSYTDGYPSYVTVWGYIDGNRVKKTNSVEYKEGERPPSDEMVATMDDERDALNPNMPRDFRYDSKLTYKYDDAGRLVEERTYQNNGEVRGRTEYVYKGNEREISDYGRDGSRWSHSFEILDKTGDVTEDYTRSDGKIENNRVFTRQYDEQGNWIAEKTFEKKIVKGKSVLKLLWTTYRKITYFSDKSAIN
jgi:hypothetical protein